MILDYLSLHVGGVYSLLTVYDGPCVPSVRERPLEFIFVLFIFFMPFTRKPVYL